jgi:hypothetical protein
MKDNLYKHLVTVLACVASASSWAQVGANGAATQVSAVPTLDEWGLIGLIAAIGVAAGIAIRRGGKK